MTIKLRQVASTLLLLLLTGCFHNNTPSWVTGWDTGYMETKGGSGDKNSLGMQVTYKYRANNDGSYDWALSYHLISEDQGWTGWHTVNALYSFYYTFTFHDSTGTHTQTSTVNLIGQGDVNNTLFVVHEPNAAGLPTFSNKHATGQRYGGASGIYIVW